MGFFKKLVGSAAVIGAAVGGVSYLKKRKEEKYTEDDIFEDFDDEWRSVTRQSGSVKEGRTGRDQYQSGYA